MGCFDLWKLVDSHKTCLQNGIWHMVFDFFYYRRISLHYYLLLSMIPQLSNFRGTIAVNLTICLNVI